MNLHVHIARQAQYQRALFIEPQQRRTLEAVRQGRMQCGEPSTDGQQVTTVLAPFAPPFDPSLEYEDMDCSSDDDDAAVTAPPSSREPTPSDQSTRDSTPALLFGDTEGSEADTDLGQRSPSLSSADLLTPIPNPVVVKADRLSSSDTETRLFFASPHASPRTSSPAQSVKSEEPSLFTLGTQSLLLGPPFFESPPPSCAVRRFLDTLSRPLGHHLATFLEIGIRTQEDINALSQMSHDWEVVHAELSKRGVTLMEWLYIKAGLEKTRQQLSATTPSKEWQG